MKKAFMILGIIALPILGWLCGAGLGEPSWSVTIMGKFVLFALCLIDWIWLLNTQK